MDGGNERARSGLQRAMSLDEVLGLMSQATALENEGALAEAREAYQKVLDVDPEWGPAREGLARTSANIARGEYETRMAAGYAAMANGDYPRARSAFEAAVRVRPGDADARSALDQLGRGTAADGCDDSGSCPLTRGAGAVGCGSRRI